MRGDAHHIRVARIASVLIISFFAAMVLVGQSLTAWKIHWLLIDGWHGTAIIVYTSKGNASYTYTVNNKTYNGSDSSVKTPGETAEVYYSDSHPWLSLLKKPNSIFPVVLKVVLTVAVASFLVLAILRPGGVRLGKLNSSETFRTPSPDRIVTRNVDVRLRRTNSPDDDGVVETSESTTVREERVELFSASHRNEPSPDKGPVERLTFRYQGPDGRGQTYHVLEEMPPHIRAIYDAVTSQPIAQALDGSGSANCAKNFGPADKTTDNPNATG